MEGNLWEGTLVLLDAEGAVLAEGMTRIEALLNPAGEWKGRLLSEHVALELPHRSYSLRSSNPAWTAMIEPMTCSPTGDGHGTVVEFRGVTAWPAGN